MKCSVGKSGLAVGDESVDVITVGVAEETRSDLVGRDADGGEAFREPAHARIVALTKSSIEKDDLFAVTEHENVDVEWKCSGGFAMLLHGGCHHGVLLAGPHEVESIVKHGVGITDGPGLNFSDAKWVDERFAESGRGLRRFCGD